MKSRSVSRSVGFHFFHDFRSPKSRKDEAPNLAKMANFYFIKYSKKGKADSTRRCSQAVPHPSTNRALRRLTSEVGRDPVYSTRYGRQREIEPEKGQPFI